MKFVSRLRQCRLFLCVLVKRYGLIRDGMNVSAPRYYVCRGQKYVTKASPLSSARTVKCFLLPVPCSGGGCQGALFCVCSLGCANKYVFDFC